jgi:chromosome segregation ATPase
MKYGLCVTLLLLLLLTWPAASRAQESSGAQQGVDSLRSQLQDVEAKQAALEARLRQLDEDMRPENIERSLRLTGSTRPEELREQRRRQLEKDRAGVQSQLDQLATSRTRLQSALSAAETASYQQSAAINTGPAPASQQTGGGNQVQPARPAQSAPDSKRRRARRNRARRRTP